MTTTRHRHDALIRARINATALRLSDKQASIDEAASELRRAATEHYIERHGRRSVQRTCLRLDLLRAEADLLASSPQTGAAAAHRLLGSWWSGLLAFTHPSGPLLVGFHVGSGTHHTSEGYAGRPISVDSPAMSPWPRPARRLPDARFAG